MSLYDELGVGPQATKAEIKAAYKRAANKHHPDKGGDVKKFQELQLAYKVLSDTDARAEYDRTGEAPGNKPPGPDRPTQIIIAAFTNAIASATDHQDLVQRVVEDLKQALRKADQEYLRFDAETARLTKLRGRVSYTGDGDNLFEQLVDSQIDTVRANREKIIDETKAIKVVLSKLTSYSCSVEAVRQMSTASTTDSFTWASNAYR